MKKVFLLTLAAIGLVAAGCSKNGFSDGDGGNDPKNGAISVTIKGENASSRAIGDISEDEEKAVKSFTVYVFNNSTGVLEKSQNFTGVLSGKITGLGVASQKKVVVFANEPEDYPAIGKYSDLNAAANMIALDSQVPGDFSAKGLFMSGESAGAVTLKTDETVTVPVTVKRLTAKVRLGSLTVTPEAGLSISDFALAGVSIQKARDKAAPTGILATEGVGYVGGLSGDGAVSKSYLHEYVQLPFDYMSGTPFGPKTYFYVLPNDDTNGQATIMSVYGQYKGTPMYYSFVINGEPGQGAKAADGTFIQRNKVYTLNITLRKIGSGGEDPNVPNEEAEMTVTVDVAPWEDELIQDVEW